MIEAGRSGAFILASQGTSPLYSRPVNEPFQDTAKAYGPFLPRVTPRIVLQLICPTALLTLALATVCPCSLSAAEAASQGSMTNMVHYPLSVEETTRLLTTRQREQIATAGRFK